MLAAIITTFFFSLSGFTGGRISKKLGSINATTVRSLLALIALALYALTLGQGIRGPGFTTLLLSGIIGFGIGDLALYQSYKQIGSRLSVLLCQCLAVPIALMTEFLWLGTTLSGLRLLIIATIIIGVIIALAPSDHPHLAPKHLLIGLSMGIIAAFGQGLGAVMSRHAYILNDAVFIEVNAPTVTFQRMLGGILIITLVYSWRFWIHPDHCRPLTPLHINKKQPFHTSLWPYVLVNASAGPIFGVIAYQWALSIAPSATVLAIVATTPIAVIPLTVIFDHDKPSKRSIFGSILSVLGVIALILTKEA